jgi:type IV secretion system protein VirB11
VASPECGEDGAVPSALEHYSRPLNELLTDPAVTEVCLQRPGELFIERASGWSRLTAPWATGAWARSFARLVATATGQRVNSESPLLSATLPGRDRDSPAQP